MSLGFDQLTPLGFFKLSLSQVEHHDTLSLITVLTLIASTITLCGVKHQHVKSIYTVNNITTVLNINGRCHEK